MKCKARYVNKLHPITVDFQGLLQLKVGKNPHRLIEPLGPVACQIAPNPTRVDPIAPQNLVTGSTTSSPRCPSAAWQHLAG